MRPRPTKRRRTTTLLLLASAVAAIAMLALAGPAAAHHGNDDGKRHHSKKHKHRFHQKKLHGSQGEAAGTIASFDAATGRLTIALADGDTVGGFVTEDTWIDDGGGCDHHDWSGDDRDWGRRQLHGWDHGDWGDDDRGSTDDLVPGAAVDEALLAISDGRAVFVKIELEGPAPGDS